MSVELIEINQKSAAEEGPLRRIFYNRGSGGKEVQELFDIIGGKESEWASVAFELSYDVLKKSFSEWSEAQKVGKCMDIRIIVAGGDGTVNWVLHELSLYEWKDAPKIAPFPMGTGNDASRHFGFGPRLGSTSIVKEDLKMVSAKDIDRIEQWDRWHVYIVNEDGEGNRDKLFARESLKVSPEEFSAAMGGTLSKLGYKGGNDEAASSNATNNKESLADESPEGFPPAVEVDVNGEEKKSEPNNSTDEQKENKDSPDEASTEASKEVSSAEAEKQNTQPEVEKAFANLTNNPKAELYHLTFYNYFSLGIDAQTMHSLEVNRKECASCHCCRCCTMTCVGLLNTRDCCLCRNPKVNLSIEFLLPHSIAEDEVKRRGVSIEKFNDEFDWVPQNELPSDGNAYVLTNLPGYAAGRSAWGKTKDNKKDSDLVNYSEARCGDGKLEFSMFEGYNHLAQMTLCGSRAHRLGVVEGIRFKVTGDIYAQFDGEAWKQTGGSIVVLRGNSVNVIAGSRSNSKCC